jgi:Arc/MetJ-type ribon-helix-helix transcriptional regulator
MRIAIEPRLRNKLQRHVDKGRFTSFDEAVNELLRARLSDEQLTRQDIAELRKEVEIGRRDVLRGRVASWSADEIWAEVERRSRKRAKKAG